MSKVTSSKTIETSNATFTKDEMKCTAFIPELGLLECDTPAYHQQARFMDKPALVEQLAYFYDDPRFDEKFWKAFRKEILAVAGAAQVAKMQAAN